MSQNYVLQKTRTITAPNGTKIKFWSDGEKEYVQLLFIAKALGYTTFNHDSSLLAMTLKNHDFQVHAKNIKNKSSYVLNAEKIVPLLKSFINLTLNVSASSPRQSLRQDDARMEAERLIELLKQQSPAESPNSDSVIIVKNSDRIIQTNCGAINVLVSESGDSYFRLDEVYKALGNTGKFNHSTSLMKVAAKTRSLRHAKFKNSCKTFYVMSLTDTVKSVLPHLRSTTHRSPHAHEVLDALLNECQEKQPAKVADEYNLARQNCFWVANWIGKDPDSFFAHCLLEHFLHTASPRKKELLGKYLEGAINLVKEI